MLGPFSLLSVAFAGRFDAGMRITVVVVVDGFGVVTSGLTDGGGTSGALVVVLTIGLFTLVVFCGAAFSFTVDSAETGKSERETMDGGLVMNLN
jgi:hypothetical protein